MSLALIAALPFLGALLPGLTIRAGRDACTLVTGSVTLLALILLGLNAPAVLAGGVGWCKRGLTGCPRLA